jgi:hypothetical protein
MLDQPAIEALRIIYEARKETIEYLCKFGNKTEKAKATLIKEAACQCF